MVTNKTPNCLLCGKAVYDILSTALDDNCNCYELNVTCYSGQQLQTKQKLKQPKFDSLGKKKTRSKYSFK